MAITVQVPALRKTWDLWIDGDSTPPLAGNYMAAVNPANGQVLADVAEARAEDVDQAVHSARRSFEQRRWTGMQPAERGRVLRRVADLIRENSEYLAVLDAMDCGKPIKDTRAMDVPAAAEVFDFYAGLPDKIRGAVIPVENEFHNYTQLEPYGVVGQIIAWNYPILNAAIKVAPALACGNSVVLKPAEQASLSAIELGRMCTEAGVPPGVLNVVSGLGPTAGAALVSHPLVPKIAFTGSTIVGREIASRGGQLLKSVTLELGGKSPQVIFPDSPLEEAAQAAVFSVFRHQGQTCSASTRTLVHRELMKGFIDAVERQSAELLVGDPLDERTDIGALISKEQLQRVVAYINIGVQEGAEMAFGGGRPLGANADGYFLQPTLLTDVTEEMRVAQEEIFGPVLAVMPFVSFDDAIKKANGVSYGLAASIWTADLKTAFRAAREVDAGIVWCNCVNVLNPASPFGGYKDSGIDTELGLEAIHAYTRTKSIWMNVAFEQRWPHI